MNAEQMRLALIALADLVSGGDGLGRANALRRFAAVFEELGTAKIATVVSTIEGNWKADNRTPQHPSELRRVVVDIRKALGHTGATTQAKAFTTLLKLFGGGGGQSVDAFVGEAIGARTKRKRSRSGAAPKRPPLTAEQARGLADQLTSAADDRTRFDALLDQLKGEKVADLKAIAGFYTGYETTKTKKDDIIRSMRQWHRDDELNRDRSAAQAKAGL
jgi:hypothetical protein